MLAGVTTAPAPPRDQGARQGLTFVVAAAGLMWVAEIVDRIVGGDLDGLGIEPREADGLIGIVAAPFLHGGFGHLIANTLPFLALGAAIALGGLARIAAVTALIAGIGGLGTWLVGGAGTVHIGASGLVFGYAAYLVVRGVFSRNLLHLGVGLIVLGLWGATLLGGLVPEDGVSWQGHLFGAIGGVVAARVLDASPSRAPAR
jgi:membrane associated rhomboid family serine protease